MRNIFFALFCSLAILNWSWAQEAPAPVVEESAFLSSYPKLKDLLFKEPPSQLYLGIGAAPLTFVGSRLGVGLSVLQLHYLSSRYDIEILNGSIQFAFGGDTRYRSNHFVLRSAPKLRLNSKISIGLVLGYEFSSFPNLKIKLAANSEETPFPEPFSVRGLIYGALMSEIFPLSNDRYIRLSEVVYKQTYSNVTTNEGLSYIPQPFEDGTNPDLTLTDPHYSFALELSYLF